MTARGRAIACAAVEQTRAAGGVPDDRVQPPGMRVERVTRDDGRALLLYTWQEPGDPPAAGRADRPERPA